MENPSTDWFVITGSTAGKDQTSGPYGLQQLREMLQAGQLTPGTRVTAPHLHGQSLSLSEVLDPAMNLFDSLQKTRDRKALKVAATGPATRAPVAAESNRFWLKLAVGGTLLLGIAAWLHRSTGPQSASAPAAPPATIAPKTVWPTSAPSVAPVRPALARPAAPAPAAASPSAVSGSSHLEELRPGEHPDERDRDADSDADRDRPPEAEPEPLREVDAAPPHTAE